MKRGYIIYTIGLVCVLLLIPFFITQFTNAVQWRTGDFVVFGVLLLCAGVGYGVLSRYAQSLNGKIIIGICIGLIVLSIWAELAVGVFDTPFAGS